MWKVRSVNCVPGSPIDCAAMMPTAPPVASSRMAAGRLPGSRPHARPASSRPGLGGRGLLRLVVLQSQMGDRLLATQITKRVLELRLLDEQVVLRVERRRAHRALEVERQPLLDPGEPTAPCKVEEQDQVERDRCRQDAVAAQEVDLDLHGVIEPAEDVDVVPAFLVVLARLVVVNMNLVLVAAIEILVERRLQDVIE